MCVVQCALWAEYLHPNKWECAVLWKKWLLFKGKELYNVESDPGQKTELSANHPDVMTRMRDHYEKWWARTEPLSRDYPPIHLGALQEPETILTSDNWVSPNTSDQICLRQAQETYGPWHTLVERAGEYEISLYRWPEESGLALAAAAPPFNGKLMKYPAGKALPITGAALQVAGLNLTMAVTGNEKAATFRVTLPSGRSDLLATFQDKDGKTLCGAYHVHVKFIR
jgi:hypothetical protein